MTWEDTGDKVIEAITSAAKRVDYRLTFAETPEPRVVHTYGMDGPDIPNAYKHADSATTGSGGWDDPDMFYDACTVPNYTEQDAIERWFVTAVREAMHEAMEWFRVDGKILLDPHGDNEDKIHTISEDAAKALLATMKENS